MNIIQSTAAFGLAFLVGLLLPHQAHGQAGPKGMDNFPGGGFRGRDMGESIMIRQIPPGLQGTFKAEARMIGSEVRQTAPVFQPVAQPVFEAVVRPVFQPIAQPIAQPVAVFEASASVSRLAPSAIDPGSAAAIQAVRSIPTPSASLFAPAAGGAPSSQNLGNNALFLQIGNVDSSPTAIATDKTPRPIVKLPPAGPASSIYLKASVAAGYTFVVSSNRYAISLVDHPGTYIQGESGTAFEVSRTGTIVLKEGVAVIGSGRDALTVNTRLAEVRMAPDSVVLIESGEFGPCKVTALKTTADDSVVVVLAEGNPPDIGNATYPVPASTEVILADHQLTPEELISSDGLDREHRKTLQEAHGWHVVSAGVSVSSLINRHPLLVAATGNKDLAQNPVIKTLIAEVQGKRPASPAPDRKHQTAEENFVGISYTTPIVLPGVRASRHASLSSSGDGQYTLTRGTVFVEAEDSMRVDTPNGILFVAPRSAVVISADDSRTQVLNLHDRRNGAVKLIVGKSSVPLAPGTEARVLKQQSVKTKTLALGDGIGRRSMRVIDVGKDVKVVVNEFSIPDALVTHPVLKQFSTSRNTPDRTLVGKIVKTAAAVAYATAGTREVYSSGR